jgi:hypothetical protein
LHALGGSGGLLGSADDVIADARQILDTAAANQDDRVLLQVVAFSGDIGSDFNAVC